MKKWIKISGLLLLSLPVVVQAEQFGDFAYTTSGSNITNTGYTGLGGAVVIPSNIVGKAVVSIGSEAFSGSGLTSVVTLN